MTIGKDRTKTDLKTDSFAVFQSSGFVNTTIKLTQNCVSFTNPHRRKGRGAVVLTA